MKRMISFVLSILLCIMAVPLNFVSFAADQTDDNFYGSGTESDPFQIRNATELALLAEVINDELVDGFYAKYRNAYFIQTADIDLKNRAWTPIGAFKESDGNTKWHYFAGHYNGNYHTIKNLNCANASNYAGLFGRLGENGKDYSDICVISNLSVYGNVSSDGYAVGGIAGEVCTGATIKNCSFTGNVSGKTDVGGIAGKTYNGGYIRNCYHNGSVTANGSVGGIIGVLNVGNTQFTDFSVNAGVYNSYHTGGKVTASNADSNLGGVVGYIYYGDNNTDHKITIENNYYLSSTCEFGANRQSIEGCTKLSSDMLVQAAELLGSPYVFNHDASVNDGYPVFEWQAKPYQFKGSGTKDDPYQISSKEELEYMRDYVNNTYFNSIYGHANYIQTADIDLENEVWIPIGFGGDGADGKGEYNYINKMYYAHYNGNYHSITNLFVDGNYGNAAGLFGYIRGSEACISNLVVSGKIIVDENAKSSDGGFDIGGIVGQPQYSSKIESCAFIGDIVGGNSSRHVGGIAGYVWACDTIRNCYHNGSISGGVSAGGIAGAIGFPTWDAGNRISAIENCYQTNGVVTGSEYSGAIVGYCYFVKEIEYSAHITNCYSIKGEASTTANVTFTSYDVTALSESMLKIAASELGSAFTTAPSTDVNNGYPVFTWQSYAPLLNWLLGNHDTTITASNWQNYDYNNDGKLNAIDLTVMKQNHLKASV